MVLTILFLVLGVGVAAWCLVLITKLQLGQVLPLELRKPVPWHGRTVFAIPIVAFFLLSIISLIAWMILKAQDPDIVIGDKSTLTSVQETLLMAAGALGTIASVVVICFVVTRIDNATLSDLGFDFSYMLRDLWIGTVTFLLILPPVFGLRALLYFIIVPIAPEIAEQKHDILETLSNDPEPIYWIILTVMVTIVAPITEEIFFRGFLQGWLEKALTKFRRVNHASTRPVELVSEQDLIPGDRVDENQIADEQSMPDSPIQEAVFQNPISDDSQQKPLDVDQAFASDDFRDVNPYSSPATQVEKPDSASFPAQHTLDLKEQPAMAWLAIACSSFFFALMHLGNSLLDPLPLFVWALIVGYVYQRTHRLLPCIVAHALFNGFTILQMALAEGN